MKTSLCILIASLVANGSFGQGQIRFDNRVTGTTSSAVVAPVYGLDPANPTSIKTGNAATGPTTPIPVGTQTYGGQPLVGTGYTASLWARKAGTTGPFVLAATTPFRNTTSTSLFGFWTVPGTAVTLPGVPSDPAVRAEIIIGVWDNQGGTITSWDQLYDPATHLATAQYANVARGASLAFIEQDQLGGGTVLPATLKGLQSFQIGWYSGIDPINPIPEPSTFAMILLGAGGVFWFGSRRGLGRK